MQCVTYLHSLSLRERILVQIVLLTVIFFICDTLMLSHHQRQIRQITIERNNLDDEIAAFDDVLLASQTTLEHAKRRYFADKNAIEQAEMTLQAKQIQIENKLNRLVPPTQIVDLLRNLLSKTDGLNVISINNEPVRDITLTIDNDNTTAADQTLLYEHAVTIKLSGNYQQLYDYLMAIESTGWELFWNTLHYQVIDYPNAEITLRVLTVSTDKHWIGL